MAANAKSNMRVKQKRLIKFGGCSQYNGCIRCTEAMRRYRHFMAQIGAKGGKARVPKGVAVWRWGANEAA